MSDWGRKKMRHDRMDVLMGKDLDSRLMEDSWVGVSRKWDLDLVPVQACLSSSPSLARSLLCVGEG